MEGTLKKILLTLLATITLGAIGVHWWGRNQAAAFLASPGSYLSPQVVPGSPPPQDAGAVSSSTVPSRANTPGVTAATHPFPGIARSRDKLALADDPFAPSSKEEQAWLDRNGYPNADQINAYSTASDATLEQAATAGDKVAANFLESRRLAAGDPNAEKHLMGMAVEGSTYALTSLAGYFGQVGARGNPSKAYAYSRLSEMRGDLKAGLTRDLVLTRPLDPIKRLEAEANALAMFEAMTQLRRKRFGPNVPAVDPRPLTRD